MSVGKWLFSRNQKENCSFFISRPGYTCKNVPGTYRYLLFDVFIFSDVYCQYCYRCIPQNCTFGEKFNAFSGRCEKMLCQPGYNVTLFGKCIGMINK